MFFNGFVQKFCSLLLSVGVYGDIIREDNYFEGTFSNNNKGRMPRVLMVFNNLPLDKCVVKCIQHVRCKTVNYHFGKMKCELTDVDFNDDEADKLSYDWYNIGTHPKVHGKWGAWVNVSDCNVKCEGGTLKQVRECDSPEPQHGGEDCSGINERTVSCNTHSCPVNGGWGAWRNITQCTALCDGGTIDQARDCDSPRPQHGGDDCVGNGERTIGCNTHLCPIVNVALNKPAVQSRWRYKDYVASRGNDGDRDTYAITRWLSHPWWQVDLGSVIKVEYIILRTQADNVNNGRFTNVLVSGKNVTNGAEKSCKHLGDVTTTDIKFSCDFTQKFRYIKVTVQHHDDRPLFIGEFEVYAKKN